MSERRWAVSRPTDPVRRIASVHGGAGNLDLRFMDFSTSSWPAKFLLLDVPPGASEGRHAHRHGDPMEPPYDECYFVAAGHGHMTIGDERIAIARGDAVFVPVGIEHGVENGSENETMSLFLTYIDRTPVEERAR